MRRGRRSGHMPSITNAWGWWYWWGWDSLEGETWLPSLQITSSHRLLGRNIKIHLDITQVFYHALSDPILPYHALHTLKHGYPFLDTLLTFKYKRWKGGATFSTRWKSFSRFLVCFLKEHQGASSFNRSNKATPWIMGNVVLIFTPALTFVHWNSHLVKSNFVIQL